MPDQSDTARIDAGAAAQEGQDGLDVGSKVVAGCGCEAAAGFSEAAPVALLRFMASTGKDKDAGL